MKRLLRPVLNLSRPLRVRMRTKVDQILDVAAARAAVAHDPVPAILEEMGRHFQALTPHFEKADERADEIALVLDAVIAELFRLQSQVEELERRLGEAPAGAVHDDGWR